MDTDEINEFIRPKPKPWQDFEAEVAEHVRKGVEDFSLGMLPQSSRVQSRPKYRSPARGTDITFDVSVEMWQEGGDRPTFIWLWECKDYPTRNVKVEEVEEFYQKLQQVSAHKGTIATRTGFDSGAVALARSYNLQLLTLKQDVTVRFQFAANAGVKYVTVAQCGYCLTSSGVDDTTPDLDDFIYHELIAAGFEQP